MIDEKSCGCTVLYREKVLLIKDTANHWGFPKGHVEPGETEVETAKRETKEETNIDVEIQEDKRYTIEYHTDKGKKKEVVYFLAKKIGGDEKPQEAEIERIRWFNYKDALNTLTYDNTKVLFKKIVNLK